MVEWLFVCFVGVVYASPSGSALGLARHIVRDLNLRSPVRYLRPAS